MDQISIGDIVCINVKALYDSFGEKLHNTAIEHCADDWPENYYYDLCNQSNGSLACMDGEKCYVVYIGKTGDIVFRNENGDEDVHFTLTAEEAKVAVYT